MRVGLVGYGIGGRCFHAPFIQAARQVDLVGVVARAEGTIEAIKKDLPSIAIYPDLASMLDAGVDVVTISTPPGTRKDLVLEAIAAGVHVIADKPFAPSAEIGRQLKAAAEARGVILGAYHNRRWDTDIRTLKAVIDSQALGEIWRVYARMEQDDPDSLEAGSDGGLLRDLGSHMVDQMLWLFGPVKAVSAQLDRAFIKGGVTDVGYDMTLLHQSGVHSHLSASKINRVVEKSYRVYGERGSYLASGTDVQADAIMAGRRPADDLTHWGYEQEALWGTLRTEEAVRIPSEQGCYHAYYEAFEHAVRTGGAAPVSAAEAVATLEVLDAARISAAEDRMVVISNL